MEATYKLEETSGRSTSKSLGWMGESLIQEEAEARLGGPEKLAAAVRRGAIKVRVQGQKGNAAQKTHAT